MIFAMLWWEFMKIGLFAIGGGLVAIPFLYELISRYGWFTEADLINMIAISESTPGPIGVNMATFAGYNVAGILGGLTATVSLVIPEIIIVLLVFIIFDRFRKNKLVDNAFYGIRPAVTALISSACVGVMKTALFDVQEIMTGNILEGLHVLAILLFFVFLYLIMKYKKHPVIYIVAAAVIGMVVPL